MKCNPLRWLWGLLPLAFVGWVALLAERPRIEADITARSQAALASRGLSWAVPEFTARDGVVTGLAGEESEKAQVTSTLAGVWGVRSVEDRTGVLETIKPYIWSAALDGSNLRLTGYVPNEAARKAVLTSAKSALPNSTVQDQLKLARGAPEQGEFLGGTAFAMKQLAGLKNGGKAALEANGLVVEGEASTAATFNTVKTALGAALPKGIALKSDRVIAPAVKPYTWGAGHKGPQVELTGHVPSKAARDQVVAAAKRAFPRANVVDRMVYGSGEPADWHKVTASALARLGQLTEGTAEVRDRDIKVAGLADREDTVETVRRSLRSDMPATFKLDEQIRLDPRIIAEREARARAEAEARAKAEADARRKVEEDARRAAAAAEAATRTAEQQRMASASDAVQRAAAEEAARQRAAAEAAARQKTAVDEAARQRAAAEDAARQRAAADEAARQRAAADEATRQRAAAEAAQRQAADTAARLTAEARRCQDDLRAAASAGSINFQRASAEIDRRSNSTLDRLAGIVKSCPNAAIEVAGHTDAEGEADRNQRLSERRARAVVDYLIKAGVPDARINAVGYGDTKPVASNSTPEDRAKNRRIEFNVQVR